VKELPLPAPGAPPWAVLRQRLLERADDLAEHGDPACAAWLRSAVAGWSAEQERWTLELSQVLSAHHDINNALVGISGNAQLLRLGPAGKEPGLRERLDVIVRECDRIKAAAGALREWKASVEASRMAPSDSRAA
jgi:signal transduction histidine kinase